MSKSESLSLIEETLAVVAPGSELRYGIDRILKANMGALIVLGDHREVIDISTGGFILDAPMTSQRLYEVAKMDGAIILTKNTKKITRANVQLTPDPNVLTHETGIRHRTAERVARSISVPVIAISEDLGTVTLYCGSERHVLQSVQFLWNRSYQLLQTLDRFKSRYDLSLASLSALEISDLATVRDVGVVIQRAEMVKRVAKEAYFDITELGKEGELLAMQLKELTYGVREEEVLVIRDYGKKTDRSFAQELCAKLENLTTSDLIDVELIASIVFGVEKSEISLDENVSARGNRLLSHIPRLPIAIAESIVNYFGTLQRIMRATEDDLGDVTGVGEARARSVKQGLTKLTEASILDRYSG